MGGESPNYLWYPSRNLINCKLRPIPWSTGPATAGSLSEVCGAFGTFPQRAYAARLRVPVASNFEAVKNLFHMHC